MATKEGGRNMTKEEVLAFAMTDYEDDWLITTVDNPFNPHTHFDEWNAWDESHGYYTTNYLARMVGLLVGYSDDEGLLEAAYAYASLETVLNDDEGLYAKAYADTPAPLLPAEG